MLTVTIKPIHAHPLLNTAITRSRVKYVEHKLLKHIEIKGDMQTRAQNLVSPNRLTYRSRKLPILLFFSLEMPLASQNDLSLELPSK